MRAYTRPRIEEIGTVEAFTRGENFAWQLDGMTLAEALHHVIIEGGDLGEVVGTS